MRKLMAGLSAGPGDYGDKAAKLAAQAFFDEYGFVDPANLYDEVRNFLDHYTGRLIDAVRNKSGLSDIDSTDAPYTQSYLYAAQDFVHKHPSIQDDDELLDEIDSYIDSFADSVAMSVTDIEDEDSDCSFCDGEGCEECEY